VACAIRDAVFCWKWKTAERSRSQETRSTHHQGAHVQSRKTDARPCVSQGSAQRPAQAQRGAGFGAMGTHRVEPCIGRGCGENRFSARQTRCRDPGLQPWYKRTYHWDERRFFNLFGSPNIFGANNVCMCPSQAVEYATYGGFAWGDVMQTKCVYCGGMRLLTPIPSVCTA